MASSINPSGVQVLGCFEADATGFVPRPRSTPRAPLAAVEQAKARWLPILIQHTVPGEGGRLVLKKETGCAEAELVVQLTIAKSGDNGSAPGQALRGQEVSIDVPGLLVLWRTGADCQEAHYLPWEAIATISFCTRK